MVQPAQQQRGQQGVLPSQQQTLLLTERSSLQLVRGGMPLRLLANPCHRRRHKLRLSRQSRL